jgi:hypothetical protein
VRAGELLVLLAGVFLLYGSSPAAAPAVGPQPRVVVFEWSGTGQATGECPHPSTGGDGCVVGYQAISWTGIYYQPLPGYPLLSLPAKYKPSGEVDTVGEEEFDSVHPNCRQGFRTGPYFAGGREDGGRFVAEPYLILTPATGCGNADLGGPVLTTDLGAFKAWADNPHATVTRTIHGSLKYPAHGVGCGNMNISSCEGVYTGTLTVTEYTGLPPAAPPPLPRLPKLPPMKVPTSGPATTTANPSPPSCARITSAAFSGSAADPSITVRGSCLGSEPAPDPAQHPAGLDGCPALSDDGYDYGTSLYLAAPAKGWSGGRYRPGLNETDCIDLVVTTFSPTEVVFHLGPFYKSVFPKFSLATGTQVTIAVNGTVASATVKYG